MTELTADQIADRRVAAQLVRGFLDDTVPADQIVAIVLTAGQERGVPGYIGIIEQLALGLAELLAATAGVAGAIKTCDLTLLDLATET
jgi:hypothetical protein